VEWLILTHLKMCFPHLQIKQQVKEAVMILLLHIQILHEVSAPYSLDVVCLDSLMAIEHTVDRWWEKRMDGSSA
jgi:hypothetical protein